MPWSSQLRFDTRKALSQESSSTRERWRSAAIVPRCLDEWARAGAAEADRDRGEHDDREHTRTDECGGVLGQHRSRVETDFGQRDEQPQGGRGEQVSEAANEVPCMGSCSKGCALSGRRRCRGVATPAGSGQSVRTILWPAIRQAR
jgi:hypothetical protein